MVGEGRSVLETVTRKFLIRLFAIVFVLFLAQGAILTWRSIQVQESVQARDWDTLGSSAARSLARLAATPLDFEDGDQVRRLISETRKGYTDVSYAAVLSSKGKLVASDPPDFVVPSEGRMDPESPSAWTTTTGGHQLRHFTVPIHLNAEKEHYFVQLGLDSSARTARLGDLRNSSILLTLGMVGIFALIVGYGWREAKEVSGKQRANDALVEATANELKAAAAQLLAVAKQSESNAVDEASSVDESRRTMAALLQSSSEIADGARSVLERAERTAEASNLIADRISVLNSQALKITGVSDTIQAIADKSDILALNASLEGTKAGEAGRGFVLLGSEMRRLAETVMAAVRQIRDLTNQIRDLSQAAVLATEQGRKLSQETTETARRIALITGQQRTGTEQVSQSIDAIQEFMRQALGGAKEAKSTANDLVRSAEHLTKMVRGAISTGPRGNTRNGRYSDAPPDTTDGRDIL